MRWRWRPTERQAPRHGYFPLLAILRALAIPEPIAKVAVQQALYGEIEPRTREALERSALPGLAPASG